MSVVARNHLRCAVERLLQPVPNVAERRHLSPAGANRARAGQAVAFALGPHEVAHRLDQTVISSRKPCQIRGTRFGVSMRNINKGNKVQVAYQTTRVVVVQLDQRLDVAAFSVRRVHELPRFFESEFYVVPAASPFPIALGWQALLEFSGRCEFAEAITCTRFRDPRDGSSVHAIDLAMSPLVLVSHMTFPKHIHCTPYSL